MSNEQVQLAGFWEGSYPIRKENIMLCAAYYLLSATPSWLFAQYLVLIYGF